MEPHVKRNKIVLAAKIILFHFRRRLKGNKIVLAAKTILFHFRRGTMLK